MLQHTGLVFLYDWYLFVHKVNIFLEFNNHLYHCEFYGGIIINHVFVVISPVEIVRCGINCQRL